MGIRKLPKIELENFRMNAERVIDELIGMREKTDSPLTTPRLTKMDLQNFRDDAWQMCDELVEIREESERVSKR